MRLEDARANPRWYEHPARDLEEVGDGVFMDVRDETIFDVVDDEALTTSYFVNPDGETVTLMRMRRR